MAKKVVSSACCCVAPSCGFYGSISGAVLSLQVHTYPNDHYPDTRDRDSYFPSLKKKEKTAE
jgi:hypothetical protein